jgi:Calcineurin-like phosphoesterase
VKILHISDFHIVSKKTLELVRRLNEKLNEVGLEMPEMHLAAADQDSILKFFIRTPDHARSYDGLIFSGDATTFGDDASMKEAAEFLRKIADHALKPECYQNIVAVPGNHDVLEHGLRVLLADLSSYLGPLGNVVLRLASKDANTIREALKTWLNSLEPEGSTTLRSSEIASFSEFIGYRFNSAFEYAHRISLKDEVKPLTIMGKSGEGSDLTVNIFPINSLPSAASLFNMGVVSDTMRENIQYAKGVIQPGRGGNGVLNFAVTHYGFMPLSEIPIIRQRGDKTNLVAFVEHSLSSQFNGYLLGSTLQDAGFDCHFHGHEHRNTAVQFDFDLSTQGSITSVGAGSVAAPREHATSFNVLEFPNEFCMTINSMTYNTQTARFSAAPSSHVFDTRGKGPTTKLARDEITRLFLSGRDSLAGADPVISSTSFAHECDSLLLDSESGIFAFGVRLNKLREKLLYIARQGTTDEQDKLRKRIKGAGFDILVVAPMPEEARTYDKYIPHTDDELLTIWRKCLGQVATDLHVDFNTLNKHVRIRTTRVPIAHAGHVKFRLSERQEPKFLRGLIQIVQIVEAYNPDVFLELNYRTNKGLLQYYAGSAWNLWNMTDDLPLWSETVVTV